MNKILFGAIVGLIASSSWAGFVDERMGAAGMGSSSPSVSPLGATSVGAKTNFVLQKGVPIHEALKSWAAASNWELIWQPTTSWKILRETRIGQTDVVSAVSEVIENLRFEGKPISLRINDGNNVMEVISTEVRND